MNTWKNILTDLELKDMINYSYILAPVTRQLNVYSGEFLEKPGVYRILWKGGWNNEREPALRIRSHGGMTDQELKMYAISPSHSSLIDPNLQRVIDTDESTQL